MKFLSKIVDFILYTNIWIGIGALLLYLQSIALLNGKYQPTNIAYLVSFSTVWLYSLHRAVGLRKVEDMEANSRFYKIHRLKIPIYIIGFFCLITSLYFIVQIDLRFLIAMAFPAFVSMMYVLPVFSGKRRLRDLSIIKIFLVALTWSWLTVLIPWYESSSGWEWKVLFTFAERFCFIFAITLPFDIRDLKTDAISNVKTIPALIGIENSQRLSYILLAVSGIFLGLQYTNNMIPPNYLKVVLLFYLLTGLLIFAIQRKQHDYYYTGLLDGTMLLMPVMVYFVTV